MLEMGHRVPPLRASCFYIRNVQIDHPGQRLSKYRREGSVVAIFPVRIALRDCAVRPYMLRSNNRFKI